MSKKIVIIGIILTIFIVFSAGCISIGGDNDELEKSLISSITGQEITDEQMDKIKELAAVVGDGDEELGVGDIIALSQKEFTDEELAVLEQYGMVNEDGSIDYAAALGALSNPDFDPSVLANMQ
ncbi:MAG TPA: hypothetical protein O0X31_05095 [Methanocorpusculum sp.]|jgi:hypothetical protein|nr:hypothetical protein [Methanocorpusculum sp.]